MSTQPTSIRPQVVRTQQSQQADTSISMLDLLFICLSHWKWFVASVAICMSLMTLKIWRTVPLYTQNAQILLKQDRGRNSSGSSAVLREMGVSDGTNNITNELYTLRSPAICLEVVKALKLDMNYLAPDFFYNKALYGKTLPVTVTFPEIGDSQTADFLLELKSDGKYKISDMKFCGKECPGTLEGRLGQTIKTPMGPLKVEQTISYNTAKARKIIVSRTTVTSATYNCVGRLSTKQPDDDATIVKLTYRDYVPQRGKDILGAVIAAYNANWVKDKNQVAVATSAFINERLAVIEKELGDVDEDISNYKADNLISSPEAVASQSMSQANATERSLIDLNNQLYMAKYIRNYLADSSNKFKLLPSSSGIQDNVGNLISSYNSKVLERNSLVANSSESNPLIVSADADLEAQRIAILHSIDNVIESLNTQMRSLQKYEGKSNSDLAHAHGQATHLLSAERQQKVKESLYVFLLQKREENEMSQAFSAYDTRVINPPSGSNVPTEPKKSKLWLMALVAGIALPLSIIVLREITSTKIRGHQDVANKTSLPYLGEIPYYGEKRPWWKFWVPKQKKHDAKIAVREGSRNVINEAFRVLRTNLEFMMANDPDKKVFALTSYNPGSGKSFLTNNIAVSFAIKRKKVLVIDGDMRHGSTSKYIDSPKRGMSDYLSGNIEDFHEVIVNHPNHKNYFVLPVGTVPPNPTELLYEEKFGTMLDTLRKEYDIIFVDCPPSDIVADTAIIEQHTDRTIFVVRAGLLEKDMLKQLDQEFAANKYKNMALLLNGTESNTGRYRYKYGYKYGYRSYGYYSKDRYGYDE